jgi:hypothetical protein
MENLRTGPFEGRARLLAGTLEDEARLVRNAAALPAYSQSINL